MLYLDLNQKHTDDKDRRAQRVWADACDIVQRSLREADRLVGLCPKFDRDGEEIAFVFRPRQQVRWTAGSPGQMEVRHVEGHALRVRVKVTDNSTSWEYDLVPPHGIPVDQLRLKLLSYLEDDEPVKPLIPAKVATKVAMKTTANGHVAQDPGQQRTEMVDQIESMPELVEVKSRSGGSISEMFRSMAGVIERQEARLSELTAANDRLKSVNARVTSLENELAVAKNTQREIEARVLELMQEEEDDEEYLAIDRLFEKMNKVRAVRAPAVAEAR